MAIKMPKIVPAPRTRSSLPPKPKRRVAFAKSDITRAVSAARVVGFDVRSIEISQDGRIRLYSEDSPSVSQSLFDEWEARL